jgi:hypothetical protein
MLTIADYKELKIYTNKKLYFRPTEKRNEGTVVFVLSPNENHVDNVLNSSLFYIQYIKGLYSPRVVNTTYLRGKRIARDQMSYYKEKRNKFKYITITKNLPEAYNKVNFFYDMSFEVKSFLDNSITTSKKRLMNFKSFIGDIINNDQLKDYSQKVVIIPIDDILDNVEKEIMNTESRITSILLLELIRYKLIDNSDFSNVDFIFYNSKLNSFFKMSSLDFDNKYLARIKSLMNTLFKVNKNEKLTPEEKALLSIETKEEEKTSSNKENLIKNNTINKISSSFDIPTIKSEIEVDSELNKIVDSEIENNDTASEEEVLDSLENNEEFLKYVNNLKDDKLVGTRDELKIKHRDQLMQKQSEIKVGEVSLKNIQDEFRAKAIITEEIPTDNIYSYMKTSKLKDFDNSYNKGQKDKDIAAIISFMSQDSELPVFVKEFKREDTSTEFDKKETFTINFEDENKVKHTFKVDVPLFIDNRFMYVNGSKKSLTKQLVFLPVVKTKADTVQVTTNYNKLFIIKYGQNVDHNVSRLQKFIEKNKDILVQNKINVKIGNNTLVNSAFTNTLEYAEISSFLVKIKVKDYIFDFNRKDLNNLLLEKEVIDSTVEWDNDKNFVIIGYNEKDKSLLINDIKTGEVFLRQKNKDIPFSNSITEGIINTISSEIPQVVSDFYSINPGRKFAYNRVTINNKKIPLVIVLAFKEGLSNLLRKYGVKYEFSEKKLKETSKNAIRFKDGYLYYDSSPLRYSLLLNGLSEMATEDFDFLEFDAKDVYLDFFYDAYGSRNISKGLTNTISLLIDPITLDILKVMNLPTEFTDLLLYCNTLLENTGYRPPNDLGNYRIRGNEQVYGYFYKILADTFRNYKDAIKSGKSDMRISVPQDILTKTIVESPMIDEYSTLNPILEVEDIGTTSYKGLAGTNLDEAFSLAMRSYDKSMAGILGSNTPDNSKVGVTRQLTYNTAILNNRGFLALNQDLKNMTAGDLLTPAELLSPFTSRHADPPRSGMQVTQGKHIIPTVQQDKPLFGSGVEKTLAHLLGSDFVFKAAEDGIVELIDEKNDLMIVKYKDGKYDTIDLSPLCSKNSAGGFYISNQKTSNLKQGEKFKKHDILASNKEYFAGGKNDTTYITGKLAKIAVTSGDFTHEDSCMISETLSQAMASKVTMMEDIVLGTNANIEHMVKKGDKVKTGDSLLIFENSFDDAAANRLLDRIGSEFEQTISELSKNIIKSKYSGEIVDIKIYYNRPIETFSDSLQKIIKKYVSTVNTRKKISSQITKGNQVNENIVFPPVEMVQKDKIKSSEVDGILIEIYIRYEDTLHIGDKVAFSTALKSIICDVTSPEETPYSEFRPDQEISAILSSMSIISRMTIDVFLQLWLNKALIGLKEKIKEIYEE